MFKLTHFARIRISNNVGSSGYQKMFNNPFCRRVKITCLQQQYRELNTDKWMYRLQARSSCRVKPINGILHVVHLSRVVQSCPEARHGTCPHIIICIYLRTHVSLLMYNVHTISQILPLGIVSQVVIATLFPKYDTLHLAFVSNQARGRKVEITRMWRGVWWLCWCDNSGAGSLYWEQSPGSHAPQN